MAQKKQQDIASSRWEFAASWPTTCVAKWCVDLKRANSNCGLLRPLSADDPAMGLSAALTGKQKRTLAFVPGVTTRRVLPISVSFLLFAHPKFAPPVSLRIWYGLPRYNGSRPIATNLAVSLGQEQ